MSNRKKRGIILDKDKRDMYIINIKIKKKGWYKMNEMTKNNLKTETDEQLKRWLNFHHVNKLNMLLDELHNRSKKPEDC